MDLQTKNMLNFFIWLITLDSIKAASFSPNKYREPEVEKPPKYQGSEILNPFLYRHSIKDSSSELSRVRNSEPISVQALK